MDERERARRMQIRRAKRRRNVLIMKCIISLLTLIVVFLAVILIKDAVIPGIKNHKNNKKPEAQQTVQQNGDGTEAQTEAADSVDDMIAQADLLAAQYDYSGAIELLKSSSLYTGSQKMQDAAAGYETTRQSCTAYPLDQVTHVFFHTMIKDDAKAFDGDSKEAGYNQVMTTMSEFTKIMESMYEKGYVMVSLHDMCIVNQDGTVSQGEILLPPGKIPFVLSQDDVSYYHYMDGDGFAQKLIVDENGDVKNTYVEDDGSISVGDYDMVPWIDTFVKQHPDFSYHGHKGIIALTGYEGVLGYRTDEVYRTREAGRVTEYQQKFFDEHPDFDEAAWQNEVDQATAVANAMKAEGWEFASHTWGHKNASESSLKELKTDNKKWEKYVAPILGKTDMIFFAFGADIGNWEGYTSDNKKYDYYKSRGYRYFCNVDSSQYWVQITDDYFRQGRRDIDGYRMYYNPEVLSDLFDVSEIWDSSRPTPVPEM